MAKKKPSDTRRRKTPIKDLPSPAGGAEKVKGGLLLSTQQLQASRQWTDGNSQPPPDLHRK